MCVVAVGPSKVAVKDINMPSSSSSRRHRGGKQQKLGQQMSESNREEKSEPKTIQLGLLFFALGILLLLRVFVYANKDRESVDVVVAASSPDGPQRSEQEFLNHGLKLIQAAAPERALEEFSEGHKRFPTNPDLALHLADTLRSLQEYKQALKAYETALELATDLKARTKARTWIGVCHRHLGDNQLAMQWLHQALTAEEGPPSTEALSQLVISYEMERNYRGVAKALSLKKHRLKDTDFQNLATALAAVGHWQLLAQVLEPCVEGLCELDGASAYKLYLYYAAALARLHKDYSEQMDNAVYLSGKSKESIEAELETFYQTAEQNRPTEPLNAIHQEISHLYAPLLPQLKYLQQHKPKMPAWRIIQDKYVDQLRHPIPQELKIDAVATLELQMNGSSIKNTIDNVDPFDCLGLPMFTLEHCNYVAGVYAQHKLAELQQQSKGDLTLLGYHSFEREDYPEPRSNNPLKVGLFSADVREHPMLSLLYAFVIHSHERQDIHLTLYHTKADPARLDEIKIYVDDLVPCSTNDFARCVQHARDKRIQVWVETTGTTGEGIPGIVASGPAPVGVLWAGFPGSMAMPETIAYMVQDRYSVPSSAASLYKEKMIYVPGSWMMADTLYLNSMVESLAVNFTREELANKYGIPLGAFVYSYFGRSWKVDDSVLTAWGKILDRTPNSVLVMTFSSPSSFGNPTEVLGNLRSFWSDTGVSNNRLIIVPPFRRGEHIHIMKELCDVALDTSMYSGGTTAYEALYAGLPLVHFSDGLKMMQRAGGSILWAAGLGETLVAQDWDQYVNLAVRLGSDAAFYNDTKQKLNDAKSRPVDGHVLFWPKVGVDAMITGMHHAYEIWRNGEEPRDIFTDEDDGRKRDEL